MHRAKERNPPSRGGVWENWQMVLNARLTKEKTNCCERRERVFEAEGGGKPLEKAGKGKKVEQEKMGIFSALVCGSRGRGAG